MPENGNVLGNHFKHEGGSDAICTLSLLLVTQCKCDWAARGPLSGSPEVIRFKKIMLCFEIDHEEWGEESVHACVLQVGVN